jgi:integrase
MNTALRVVGGADSFGSSGPPRGRHVAQDDGDDDPRGDLTLAQCWERFLRPEQERHGEKSTLAVYRTTLKAWGRIMGEQPVRQITSEQLQRWQDKRASQLGSPATVDKEWRSIRAILRRIGPYTEGNPQAMEILRRVPYLRPLGTSHMQTPGYKRLIVADYWNAIHEACRVAEFSTCARVPGPLAWRTAFALDLGIGARTSDLFGLRWKNFHLQSRCPVHNWPLEHPHGWVWFVAKKTEKHHVIPLPAFVRAHLDALLAVQPRVSPDSQVLPLGGTTSADDKVRQLVRKLVQQAARIEEPFTFQEMRAACNMLWNQAHYPAGQWVLGHACGGNGLNDTYYTVGLPFMLKGVERLEVPAAFSRGPG